MPSERQSPSPTDRAAKASVPVAACSLARAAALIGDRWTLLILREAFYGVRRFADFEADLAIPRSVLSQRLRAMVEAGLLAKAPYREAGARRRWEYTLTPMAADLYAAVAALTQWGDRHLRADAPPLHFVDAKTGAPLQVGFVAPGGRAVPAAQVGVRIRKPAATR